MPFGPVDWINENVVGGKAEGPRGTGYQGLEGDVAKYNAIGDAASARKAPPTNWGQANADYSRSQGAYGQMGSAADMFRQAAMGNGPSAAQQVMGVGNQQALAAQAAQAASARGGPQAQIAAQNAASANMANLQGQNTAQMAQLRAQEQQAGMQGYAGMATQLAAAADRSRGLSQGQGQFDVQAGLQQQALNDAQQRGMYGLIAGAKGAQLNADTALAQKGADVGMANAASNSNLFGGLLSGGGAALSMLGL